MSPRSSDFYQVRRGWIRDGFGALGFLAGFIGSSPIGWPMMQADVNDGEMARGLFKFFGVVMAGGVVSGIVGLVVGVAAGILWERIHRLRRPPPPSPSTIDSESNDAPRVKPRKPETAWAIKYDVHPLDVDRFVELANRVWPKPYDHVAAAPALGRTTNIGAWHDARLVGAVRVLSDGYFFSTVPELMVDPDYRGLGIGRELMRRAVAASPRGALFFGAQRESVRFFERIGATRGPIGFVMRRDG